MALPFFDGRTAARRPDPIRLVSVKPNLPLLVCVLRKWQSLWVHYLFEQNRTAIHFPQNCPHCAAGKVAQERAYAPALVMPGQATYTGAEPRWTGIWARAVIELPAEAYKAVEPGWPAVWRCERLDRRNGRVRVTQDKPAKPLPQVTELWEIEPTIRKVFGLPAEPEGGAN